MKTYVYLFLVCLCGGLISCTDDDADLVDPQYKTWEISCGGDIEVPVLGNNWRIEYVQDVSSGEKMSDKNGNRLALDGKGQSEAANGWLTLLCDKEDAFTLNLKENFDKNEERKFLICIRADGFYDYITVVQRAGTEYKLVKSAFTEIEKERHIYKSTKDCISLVLRNHTSEAVWEPTGYIFENVIASSHFESDDYGAFDWIPEKGIEINMPELIIDHAIYWGNRCSYQEGISTTPYIKDIPNGNKILLYPNSILYLSGSITYCKRVCKYTFTIQNIETGTQFEVNGTWTQVVPISSHTISSDTPT